jgi:hypothetical protein
MPTSGWLFSIFAVGVVVAVCLSLEEPPHGDGSVRDVVEPAGVLHDRDRVVDVVPASNGPHPPGVFETMMKWINSPSVVVAIGIIVLGVVLIVLLRPRAPRD